MLQAFLKCLDNPCSLIYLWGNKKLIRSSACMGFSEEWLGESLESPRVLSVIFSPRAAQFFQRNILHSTACRFSAMLPGVLSFKKITLKTIILSFISALMRSFIVILPPWATFRKNSFCSSHCMVEWLKILWLWACLEWDHQIRVFNAAFF